MRTFEDLSAVLARSAVKLKDLLDVDRDLGKLPPDQQKALARASFGPFLTHPEMDDELLGWFVESAIMCAEKYPPGTPFRAEVFGFGCDAVRRMTHDNPCALDTIIKGLFALADEGREKQTAVLAAGVYNLTYSERDFIAVTPLALELFTLTNGFPEQRAAALEQTVRISSAALRSDGPDEAVGFYLLARILNGLQPGEADALLRDRLTEPALAAVVTCMPDPSRSPPPDSVTFAFALLAAQGVRLSPEEGFCCREFMLAPECPELGGRLVVALFPDAPPQQQLLERRHALGQLSSWAEKKCQAPAPAAYYGGILSAFEAVATDHTITPLPFPEAVAVHKRGCSTWPRVANN